MTLNNNFIAVVGQQGVGKTTLANNLHAFMQAHVCETVLTRDPGGTVFAEQVRTMISQDIDDISSYSQHLVRAAARWDLAEKIIKPALEGGQIVISDGYELDEWIQSGDMSENTHGPCSMHVSSGLPKPHYVVLLRSQSNDLSDREIIQQQVLLEDAPPYYKCKGYSVVHAGATPDATINLVLKELGLLVQA